MVRVYIALGSNLHHPRRQIQRAVASLEALPGCRVEQLSSWYQSHAWGPLQPPYVNGVLRLATRLAPTKLLAALQRIEKNQGRVRNGRWKARTLDLDLLLYGNAVIDTTSLQVPHPAMIERNFVLFPLFEIAPLLTLPDGRPLEPLLRQLNMRGLRRLPFCATLPLYRKTRRP